VGEHIAQGKLPTQLALTWAGRVSFVLTEALTLKKIELLDGVLEGAGVDAANSGSSADDGGFDADVAIATGELRQLLPALVEALGGLQERGAAADSGPGAAAASAAPLAPGAPARPAAPARQPAAALGVPPTPGASRAPWDEPVEEA
jgi:recombination associated protein RdgC